LQACAKEIEATGRRALACPVDVSDAGAVDAAALRVESELGPIDVWVNDAMTTVFSTFAEIEPDDFRRAVEVTFLGQVWGTRAALERMRPRNRGAIVNVGSALAFTGIPLQSPYCASKFACRGFFESLRAELLHDRSKIRLSMVHLPAVNTPQFDWCKNTTDRRPQPVPPIYQPEIAAQFIVDVAIDGRRAKVVGSWNKLLVAAASVAPAVVNQFAAIGAWEAQLTADPAEPDAPVNLYEPVDDVSDFGARGRFDDLAGGFLTPDYLQTLPDTAAKAARASLRSLAEKVRWRARRLWATARHRRA